jgi:hypothetical protein
VLANIKGIGKQRTEKKCLMIFTVSARNKQKHLAGWMEGAEFLP